jgi:hypothetical protein
VVGSDDTVFALGHNGGSVRHFINGVRFFLIGSKQCDAIYFLHKIIKCKTLRKLKRIF